MLLGGGWGVGANAEISYNWKAASDSRWTVPLAVSVTKVVPFMGSYMNLGVAAVSYVERPSWAPTWELRLNATYVIR